MKHALVRTVSAVAVALLVSGCTTTYSNADLRAKEIQTDAKTEEEIVNDEELGEEGGENMEALREERARAAEESEIEPGGWD